jgi:hypothetical protein
MSAETQRTYTRINFDATDDTFFALNIYSEEMMFAVSGKLTFLKPANDKYTRKGSKRLLELRDNLDLTLYALIQHAKSCQDQSLPEETKPNVEESVKTVHEVTEITRELPQAPMPRVFCTVSSTEAVVKTHPSNRQKELCYYTKLILGHTSKCRNKACSNEYCQVFKDIVEFMFLFARLRRN